MLNTLKHEAKSLAIYVTILVGFLLQVNHITSTAVSNLKTEINTVVREQCLTNQTGATLAKYNDHLQTEIDQERSFATLNRARGNDAKAVVDQSYADRLSADKIPVPSQKQLKARCAQPLLK